MDARGEAAKVLGMPETTIRFYGKNGLMPNVSRTGGGARLFDVDIQIILPAAALALLV